MAHGKPPRNKTVVVSGVFILIVVVRKAGPQHRTALGGMSQLHPFCVRELWGVFLHGSLLIHIFFPQTLTKSSGIIFQINICTQVLDSESALGRTQIKMAQWKRIHLPMEKLQERQVQSLGREDPLEEEMATHSSILPGIIP